MTFNLTHLSDEYGADLNDFYIRNTELLAEFLKMDIEAVYYHRGNIYCNEMVYHAFLFDYNLEFRLRAINDLFGVDDGL